MEILNQRRWKRVLLPVVVILMSLFVSISMPTYGDDLRPQVASLVSSPGRCELKSGQKVCRMTLNLIWEAPEESHYCISQAEQAEPIKCWQNAWRGSVEISFNEAKKTLFLLKHSTSEQALVETSVAVTGSYQQRKRAQRRKRGFWRMF